MYLFRIVCILNLIRELSFMFKYIQIFTYYRGVGAGWQVPHIPIFASSILIYKELGWESFAERRKRRKLQMFYNIQNNNAL